MVLRRDGKMCVVEVKNCDGEGGSQRTRKKLNADQLQSCPSREGNLLSKFLCVRPASMDCALVNFHSLQPQNTLKLEETRKEKKANIESHGYMLQAMPISRSETTSSKRNCIATRDAHPIFLSLTVSNTEY